MVYYSNQQYKLITFKKSKKKGKKYDAILLNKKTGMLVSVPFGGIKKNGIPYEQYKDTTGNGLYSKYDHNDKKRRKRYRQRHMTYLKPGYFSPGYFSWKYLW